MNKATLYFQSEFGMGIKKLEVRDLIVEVKPYAQYPRGVFARFIPKGGRLTREIVQGYKPNLLVIEGWNHPEPPSAWGKAKNAGNGVSVQVSNYACFDERWERDFNKLIDAHVQATGAKVLHDFRDHNASRQTG